MLKVIFLLLMSGGLPVAIAMAGSALLYILYSGNLPPFVVIHRMVSGIDSFPLLAVPFFILAGNLMNNAGITNRIYNYALALVGWLKGGLGHVNVVGSVVFAGMSGTAIADAAGLGTIEIKAMKDHGYETEFAVGVTAASATLGPIIPPSLPFVIYGMMANVSGRAVPGRHPAGRADGGADDAHGGLVRAQERLGRRRQVRVAARDQGPRRDPGGRGLARGALAAGREGRPAAAADGAGRRHRAVHRRPHLQVPGRAAHHDAGAADRRHDHGRVHAHRGRDRRLPVGHGAGLRLVPHPQLEDVREGLPGHGGDHRDRAVHRGGGQHLRLDAHGHRRRRRSPPGCWPSPRSSGCSCCWPTC